MKIYDKIVVDMETLEVVEESSRKYTGPVAECKGGGSSTTTTVDPVYNAGMLEMSQEQQDWASEMYNMFKYGVDYDPNEVQQGAWVDGKWIQKDNLGEASGYSSDHYVENPEWAKWNQQMQRTTDRNREYWMSNNPEPEKTIANPSALQERTYGEIHGYDPNSQTSELEYLQNVVESNQSLLGLQTDANAANLETNIAAANAKRELIPFSTDTAKAGLNTQRIGYETESGMIPLRAGLERKHIESESALLPQRTAAQSKRLGLASSFMSDANKGVDIGDRMDRAEADVKHGLKGATEAMNRRTASFGLDPNSGKFSSLNRDMALKEASGVAGARTSARTQGENENFRRKQAGLSISL